MDDSKRRLRELRERELHASLTEAERVELARLLDDADAAEALLLGPAIHRMRQERESLEQQNLALESLARRKQALARRLREVLAESKSERQAIDRELAEVLGDDRGLQTAE